MYAYIHGSLEYLEHNSAVVEAAGVGYQLSISGNTWEKLARLDDSQKKDVKLFTHMSVREDGVELFGFHSHEELSVFRLLITVSGVGPKVALSVLTFMTPEKLAFCVTTGDQKSIAKAPGLGPKTAARIVLELKDKLHSESGAGTEEIPATVLRSAPDGRQAEAIDALTVLGFSRTAAADAVGRVSPTAEVEDIIRDALKLLMK